MQRKWKRHWQRLAKMIMPPLTAGILLMSTYNPAYANPAGGQVTGGAATITTNGARTTINQTSNKAAINWQSFNIAKGETVNFVQPSASAVALNRVIGNNASAIYGTLSANGKVFLINPNGVLFAPGSQVNVGGLVASTLNMFDSDFMNGNYTFSGSGTGSVINQGAIQAAGQAVLIGPQVKNEGTIAAQVTGLAAGNKVSLDFSGDKLLNLTVDTGAAGGSAVNNGTILSDGGLVVMSAGTKSALLTTVVNNSGMIRAQSVNSENGVIKLEGSTVTNNGTLDASGKAVGQTGGTVKVLGDTVTLAQGSSIDVAGDRGGGTALIGGAYQGGSSEYAATKTTVAQGTSIKADALTSGNGGQVIVWSNDTTTFAGSISATGGTAGGDGGSVETSGHHTLTVADTASVNTTAVNGKTGNWLLDPADFVVDDTGSKGMKAAVLSNALNNSSITITTTSGTATATNGNTSVGSNSDINGNGDITISSAVSWNTPANILTLSAYRNININAAITASGDNAGLALACGTGTTGTYSLGNRAKITLSGSGAKFSLNGDNYEVINSHSTSGALNALQAIGTDSTTLGKSYFLGADIDASGIGTGVQPIGTLSNIFTGSFDGGGHTISGLTINTANAANTHSVYAGLFGCTSSTATIRNLGLVNSSVIGTVTSPSDDINAYVGGLVGENEGTITNCYSSGDVIATAIATGTNSAITNAGGLVGENNEGTITNCYSSSNVTGTATATNNAQAKVGGLAGGNYSSGIITNCYSNGDVTATATGTFAATYAGGLVGDNLWSTIDNCYSTSSVTAVDYTVANVGGLVGNNSYYGTIQNCYSTGDVAVEDDIRANVGGLVGYNDNYGTIKNCYSTGAVTVHKQHTNGAYTGGLVGGNANASNVGDAGIIMDCYWNTDTSGIPSTGIGDGTNSGATGLSTSQMQTSSSYTNWDTSVWRIYEGHTYPLLRSFLTPLTVTVTDATTTYSGSAQSAAVSYSTTPNSALLGTFSLSYTNNATGVTGAAINAGTYTVSGGSGLYSTQQGYDISYGGSGTLTINPAALTVKAAAQSKTYGSNDPALTYSVTGLQGSDTAAGVLNGSLTRTAGETVTGGLYAITQGTLTLLGNANYTLSYIGNFLTINPATLTVKANDVSRYYGYENPAFTYTVVSGLIGSDTKNDVVKNLALTTTAIRTSPVAQYDITLGDKQISSNYALNFIPGKLTVNQAPWQYNSYQGAVSYVYRLAGQSGLTVGNYVTNGDYQTSTTGDVPGLTVVETGINIDGLLASTGGLNETE